MWDMETAERAGRAVDVCVCVKEKTEVCNDGPSRRFSAWWGGWGTRRGLKEA